MPEPSAKSKEKQKIPFFSRLQVKYALSYLALLAVVLVLLNTYPLIASQNLLISSKEDSLRSQIAVMSSALMELETLSADQVARVMNMLDNMGLERILVTDPSGLILYDSLTQGQESEGDASSAQSPPDAGGGAASAQPSYQYALFQEVALALQGNDVLYTHYEDGVFLSTAAAPILYRGMTIGGIYICDWDNTQGTLLMSLQQNLRTISLVLMVIALLVSFFFSKVLTSRIGALLRAIRIVGEGEYGHRLQPAGKDELAHLAEEFNQLTDRLQTTEEVRRRFVSDASHELKTPLASIRLLTDSILQNDGIDPETVQEFVSDIGEEAERLTRITEKLLALTRLDNGRAVALVPVDVGKVAEKVERMLSPLARAVNVTLELHLEPGCLILATEDDIYQVAFNLMENAVKYNLPGGRVMVTLTLTGPQLDSVLLRIEDTGVGIPEQDLPKIFDRFYRVDKARSRAAGGTGLGLSIVRDTVRQHGGSVSVRRREPEPGSCFEVRFPRWQQKEERP